AEITTAPPTPLAAQSARAPSTWGAGTVITARSTVPSTAASDGAASTPWTVAARAFTATTRPAKPADRRLASTLPPTLAAPRDAPMTATLAGRRKQSRDGRPARPASVVTDASLRLADGEDPTREIRRQHDPMKDLAHLLTAPLRLRGAAVGSPRRRPPAHG